MNEYINVLKKYADFKGRASMKEYWMFFLFNIIIAFSLGLVEGALGLFSYSDDSILATIYQFAILIPSLAVGFRRVHDVDKNGWFYLIPIYSLILVLTKGTTGQNQYGPDPLVNGEQETSNFCSGCGNPIDANSELCTNCSGSTNTN
ncbi:DUF805 domain-containing protein [Patescibacteria group bacterium]